MIDQNIIDLKNDFQRIKEKGWIKSLYKGTGGIGLTFEKMLNKEIENFEIPDYQGIEIKTHWSFSKSYTTLFNATPDGKELFEIKRLRNKYGYPDKDLKNYKVFYGFVNATEKNFIGIKHQYKLNVNKDEKRIYLNIYDKKGNLIDTDTYWSFDMLEEKLKRKLTTLAYVKALKRTKNKEEYFKYISITFYQLKSFETFINLIEDGTIIINFNVGIFKKGDKIGEIYDHGTGIRIDNKDLDKLFDIIVYK